MSEALAESYSEHAAKLRAGKRVWELSGRVRDGKLLWRSRPAIQKDIDRLDEDASHYYLRG